VSSIRDSKDIENEKIVERLKARMLECRTNNNRINAKTQWSKYCDQHKLDFELQSILEGKA
jgi:hypothetical protein